MSFTNAEAQSLLEMPKRIVYKDELQDQFTLRTNGRYNIRSLDGNYVFLMQIRQDPRKRLKLDLHFQENSQYIGLLRVDYNNTLPHKNPENLNEHVPEYAIPYRGQYVYDSHIHFHVQGYKTLAWAVPLPVYRFSVEAVTDNSSLFSAIAAFCDSIGLTTRLQYEGDLLL